MSGKDAKLRPPSALARALKAYRELHKHTQEELAILLDEDPRQIRRWEHNETSLPDIQQLKNIADRLGIPYEHLGIAPSIHVPLSLEQINAMVDRVWSLIEEGRINEAFAISENGVRDTINQAEIRKHESAFFHTFTRLYHAAAHAASLSARTEETGLPVYYYQQMEYFARQAKDDTSINLSLSYQGDIQRRKGDISRAITLLEAARDTTLGASKAARGNMWQLLARSYIRANKLQEFDTAMKQSEELAYEIRQQGTDTVQQFHLPHVYEEYAKGYDTLGRTQEALDYIDRAEKLQALTKNVEILLKTARAEVLMHSGDLRNGEPFAVEAALYSKAHGHYRRLERLYLLKRYVNQQMLKYGKTELALSEALEGRVEDR